MDPSLPPGQLGAPTHDLLLDALETALSWTAAPPDAHHVLCRLAAQACGARVAGYARHDKAARTTRLVLWQGGPTPACQVRYEREEPSGRDDWWTPSRGRRTLLTVLDQRHLAELPLDLGPARPSLVVVGRADPLTPADGERLGRARRALCALELLLRRLEPVPPTPTGEEAADLTIREREVLQMLAEGLLARSIAQRLAVSERTVHKHLGNVYRKLDAHDRLLAVRRAERLGIVTVPTAATVDSAAAVDEVVEVRMAATAGAARDSRL